MLCGQFLDEMSNERALANTRLSDHVDRHCTLTRALEGCPKCRKLTSAPYERKRRGMPYWTALRYMCSQTLQDRRPRRALGWVEGQQVHAQALEILRHPTH